MNTTFPLPRHMLLAPLLALACLPGIAAAQQQPYLQTPQGYQQQQPGYGNGGYQARRPGVGERVGGFVKRMFYGEPAPAPAYRTPPPTNQRYQPGRSLDAPPSAAPRYDYAPQTSPQPAARTQPPAPQPAAKKNTPAPKTTPPAKTSSSPSKYTPPKIKPNPDAPPPAPKPSTSPQPKPQEPKIEIPKIEQDPPAPSPSSAPTPGLDNKPTEAPANVASLSTTLPGMDIPPIKEPEPPATSGGSSATKEPPASTSSPSSSQFLVGKKTAVPGRVVSPYPPYQELDVTGLASGSLALDPTTDKVFEIP